MKKLQYIVPLMIAACFFFACALRPDTSDVTAKVDFEISAPMSETALGGKSLIGDTAVVSVSVSAEDADGAILGTVGLEKGDTKWRGSMVITVEESTPVTFRARGYAGAGATGNVLYYGTSERTITASDIALSVSISTALQELAQWARTSSTGGGNCIFQDVATDGSGNVYAVGYQNDTSSFTYGDGVSVAGASWASNAILVKYDSSGVAQWARTVSSGSDGGLFNDVAVDSSGAVYAVGYQRGTSEYTYGAGVSVAGTCTGCNAVLVKYDASGAAQWARTTTGGTGTEGLYEGVAVDGSGNVFAAGWQWGTDSYIYGVGVSATGPYQCANVLLLKYDSSGSAQWAKTLSSGDSDSQFLDVSVDGSGNVYAAGWQCGNTEFNYGNDIKISGTSIYGSSILVKYASSSETLWARTVVSGESGDSALWGVSVDGSGNVFTAGYQSGTDSFTYGNGVGAAGFSAGNYSSVLVKYNSSGTAQWARSGGSANGTCIFYGVSVDSSGNAFAAGSQYNTGTYTYGSGVSVAGSIIDSDNVALVKYDSSGTAKWARTVSSGGASCGFNGVSVDDSGNIYAAGTQAYDGNYTYGTGVSAKSNSSVTSIVLVKYGLPE